MGPLGEVLVAENYMDSGFVGEVSAAVEYLHMDHLLEPHKLKRGRWKEVPLPSALSLVAHHSGLELEVPLEELVEEEGHEVLHMDSEWVELAEAPHKKNMDQTQEEAHIDLMEVRGLVLQSC